MFLQTSLFSKDGFGFTAQLCGSKLGSCPSSPEGKHCLIYSLRKSGAEWLTNPFLSPVSSSSRSQLPSQCRPVWGCCRLQAKPGLMRTGCNYLDEVTEWVTTSPEPLAWGWEVSLTCWTAQAVKVRCRTCPSIWRAGAGSFSSHPCLHHWSSGGPWFEAILDATAQTWPRTTPMPGLSSLNRGYFSQAWREEWSEPEIPQVPSPRLLWRQRSLSFARYRPYSRLCLDDFSLHSHAHISVNVICVLCAKISIKKKCSQC